MTEETIDHVKCKISSVKIIFLYDKYLVKMVGSFYEM